MAVLWNLRYALRNLRKSRAFTAAVVLSLGLGIGANTAIFSLLNGLLLHPESVADPARVVAPRVNYKKLKLERIGLSATDFADIRKSRDVFATAGLLEMQDFNYTGSATPLRLQAGLVTWQWFDVFEAKPLLGRGFRQEEDQPGANHEAVLSYAAWKKLFGGDSTIVGHSIELNQAAYRVVGVMPQNFRWPAEADLWLPIGLAPEAYGPRNRFNENYVAVARLAPGVSYEQALSKLQTLSKQVLDEVPFARGAEWGMTLEPFTEYTAGSLKTPMYLLFGAVGLVLLIACSNVAGLLLVRGAGRARELAIRAALGASRADLLSQAMAEVALLGVAGTALGIGLAYLILKALLSLALAHLAIGLSTGIDADVLLFAIAAGILATLAFGLAPAWHTSGIRHGYAQLKEGSRSDTEGQHRQRLRAALVTGQIALALVLLVGTGLLLQTLANLREVHTGFNGRGVVTATVALPVPAYADAAKQVAFYRALLDRLESTPGIVAAGAINSIPFGGGDPTASFGIEGRILGPGDPGFHGSSRYATPDYFKTMQIPLLAGRYFNDADTASGEPVAIIDSTLARRYFSNQNPIGNRIRCSSSWARIVGIVGHVKQTSLAADAGRGAYYFPLYQQARTEMFLAARGTLPTLQVERAMREAVHSVDPTQAIFDVKTIEERISLALGPQQFAAQLLFVFAAAALALALIGLYGVISYSVTRRTREIGIRAALGAERGRILALILGQAMRVVFYGIAAGALIAAGLTYWASAQWFGVSPFDPLTFAGMSIALASAGLAASLVPAWRAARVDPIQALRNE